MTTPYQPVTVCGQCDYGLHINCVELRSATAKTGAIRCACDCAPEARAIIRQTFVPSRTCKLPGHDHLMVHCTDCRRIIHMYCPERGPHNPSHPG